MPATLAPSETLLLENARVFAALGDPARLRILNLIRHGKEVCNCEIAPITGFLPSKISRHLALLRHAGLIRERREGTFIHYRLGSDDDTFRSVLYDLIDQLAKTDPVLQDDRKLLRKCQRC